jgi:hypothetical protein
MESKNVLADSTPSVRAYENKRRAELLDEVFAYFFDYEDVTPEVMYSEIKAAAKSWKDYYTKFVAKADQLIELLEKADET